jgi:hypothetical protein
MILSGSIMRCVALVLAACSSPSRGGPEPKRDGAAPPPAVATPAPATTPARAAPPAAPTPPRGDGLSHKVRPADVVFIGKARPTAPLDCATFDRADARHRRAPQPLHDATDYPQRHWVPVEIVEVVRNPSGVATDAPQRLSRGPGHPPTASVAWALGPEAFEQTRRDSPGAYDAAFCRRLNQTLAAPFVVVHAIPIYVDRSNATFDPWEAAWASIGVQLDSNTAGFATLEKARAWLQQLDPSTKPTGAE